MMTRFHSIYEKLNRVLVKTPFDELMISNDVKEEVNYSRGDVRVSAHNSAEI